MSRSIKLLGPGKGRQDVAACRGPVDDISLLVGNPGSRGHLGVVAAARVPSQVATAADGAKGGALAVGVRAVVVLAHDGLLWRGAQGGGQLVAHRSA